MPSNEGEMSNMWEWDKKLPQNSMFLALPLPGIILPVDPGGVKRYEWHVWTPAGFCGGAEHLKIMTVFSDLSHPY